LQGRHGFCGQLPYGLDVLGREVTDTNEIHRPRVFDECLNTIRGSR